MPGLHTFITIISLVFVINISSINSLKSLGNVEIELTAQRSTSLTFRVIFPNETDKFSPIFYKDEFHDKREIKFRSTSATILLMLVCLRPGIRYFIESPHSRNQTLEYETLSYYPNETFDGKTCKMSSDIFEPIILNAKSEFIHLASSKSKCQTIYFGGEQDSTNAKITQNEFTVEGRCLKDSSSLYILVTGQRPHVHLQPLLMVNETMATNDSVTLFWRQLAAPNNSIWIIQYGASHIKNIEMELPLHVTQVTLQNLFCCTLYDISLCTLSYGIKFCSSMKVWTHSVDPRPVDSLTISNLTSTAVKLNWISSQNCSNFQYFLKISPSMKCLIYQIRDDPLNINEKSQMMEDLFSDCNSTLRIKVTYFPIDRAVITNLDSFTNFTFVLSVIGSDNISQSENISVKTLHLKSESVTGLNVTEILPFQFVTWTSPHRTNGIISGYNVSLYSHKSKTTSYFYSNFKKIIDLKEIESTANIDSCSTSAYELVVNATSSFVIKCYLQAHGVNKVSVAPVNEGGIGELSFVEISVEHRLPIMNQKIKIKEYFDGEILDNHIEITIPFYIYNPNEVKIGNYSLVIKSTDIKPEIERYKIFHKHSLFEETWNETEAGTKDIYEIRVFRERDSQKFKIGKDTTCDERKKRIYCNGPLQPLTEYEVAFRAYSSDGFVTTPSVKYFYHGAHLFSIGSFRVTQSHLILIAIPGAIIFILLIILIAAIIKKRNKQSYRARLRRSSSSFRSSTKETTAPNVQLNSVYEEIRDDDMMKISEAEFLLSTSIYEEIGNDYSFYYKTVLESRQKNISLYEEVLDLESLPQPIPLEDLDQKVIDLQNELKYIDKFKILGQHSNSYNEREGLTTTKGLLKGNSDKNRFPFIMPYDNNCVAIRSEPEHQKCGDRNCDYINASYIPGYFYDRQYIVTQAPLQNTVVDFWTMVDEQGCQLIINITKLEEGENSVKFCKYWPNLGNHSCFDKFSITTIDEKSNDTLSVRQFQMKFNDGLSRCINQIHFYSWPNKIEPNCIELNSLFVKYRSIDHGHRKQSVVVHDCAGIGQAGSFILLNNFMDQIEAGISREIDVNGAILHLRKYRSLMINSPLQYLFLHKFLKFWLEINNYLDIDMSAYENKSDYLEMKIPQMINDKYVDCL